MKQTQIAFYAIFLIFIQSFSNISVNSSSVSFVMLLNRLDELNYSSKIKLNPLLLSSIKLTLKTEGKIDKVQELLQQLYDDLLNQQNNAESDHRLKNTEWSGTLNQYESDITRLTNQISDHEFQVLNLSKEINDLNDSLKTLKQLRDSLANQKTALENARSRDIESYKKRKEDQNDLLKALNTIIDKLKAKVTNNQFFELKNALKDLKKSKETEKFSNLIALTMSFDPKAVNTIISKLESIKNAVEASLQDDETKEIQAEADYINLLDIINNNIESNRVAIKNDEDTLIEKENNLKETQILVDNEKNILEITKSNKEILIKTRNDYNKNYEIEHSKRAEEINTIKQVQTLIAAHNEAIKKNEK